MAAVAGPGAERDIGIAAPAVGQHRQLFRRNALQGLVQDGEQLRRALPHAEGDARRRLAHGGDDVQLVFKIAVYEIAGADLGNDGGVNLAAGDFFQAVDGIGGQHQAHAGVALA